MKKNAIIIFSIIFLAAVALPGWSCQRSRSENGSKKVEWVVQNRNHRQRLGGKSVHAWRGLSRAAARSNGVETETETDTAKDTGDKTIDESPTIQK